MVISGQLHSGFLLPPLLRIPIALFCGFSFRESNISSSQFIPPIVFQIFYWVIILHFHFNRLNLDDFSCDACFFWLSILHVPCLLSCLNELIPVVVVPHSKASSAESCFLTYRFCFCLLLDLNFALLNIVNICLRSLVMLVVL